MKEIKNKEFLPEIKVFSGVKDVFGNNVLILVNDDLGEFRTVSKNKEYEKQKKELAAKKLSHVIPEKYLTVIDFTADVVREMEKAFPGYRHTAFQIWLGDRNNDFR